MIPFFRKRVGALFHTPLGWRQHKVWSGESVAFEVVSGKGGPAAGSARHRKSEATHQAQIVACR